ncbi:hypothetical protein B0H13DRAFT_2424175 [Mycena leptocephala]|nr:hypothetical protein B0H13DRAFT_2424175 [Mycena leptocephala]
MASQIPTASQRMAIVPRTMNKRGDLVQTSLLASVGVAINTELEMYICLPCGSAQVHSEDDNGGVLMHIRRDHKGADSAVRNHIIERTHGFKIRADFPKIPRLIEPRPSFSGVRIKRDKYGCRKCPYVAGKKRVQKHMRDNKKCQDTLGRISSGLATQVLNSGDCKTQFRVVELEDSKPFTDDDEPPNPRSSSPYSDPYSDLTPCPPTQRPPPPTQSQRAPPPTQQPPPLTQHSLAAKSLCDLVVDFDPKEYRAEELPNSRMINPWLLRNGWHEHLHPYQEHDEELRQLASVPVDDEFPFLHEAVASYFWTATDLIKGTNEVVLQRLNSADPDKNGINNVPLHAFHQEDKTFRQYINVILRLLASLLREPEHYHMPVSEQLKGAVQAVVDSTNAEELCSELHPLLLAMWKTQWEATANHVIHDPTMCFLALSSLEKTGEFAGPKKTTGPIAKLCWGIKLCMLTEIHELVKSGQCKDQLEAFKMIAPFVIEHELTTFHHLRSLTHYATTLAYTTMEAPNIIWTDRETWREMLYLGERISLEQLQKVLGKLEEEIAELWEDRIMLNTELHVKYGELSDNLANTNPGYSFITNPLNPFAHTGTRVEELQLNMDYSRKWLGDLADLEGLVMLYTELTPGALIRWTELASLQMQNTQYRLRNALGVGKFVALVRQYDKTGNTAQRDRFIPHAASGFVADLLIQLHTFARPFAQFLASKVFPGEPDIVGMYGDLLFMNFGKQFTTDKLSSLMAQWTSPVLGWSMTIQPLRQINTAFRRKHYLSYPGIVRTIPAL